MTPRSLLGPLEQLLASRLLENEEDPASRKDVYFLFRWLFQELLLNLNLLRNNDLIRYLNYQILRKSPQLLAYIKNRIKLTQQMKQTPQAVFEPTQDEAAEYLKAIDKAIQVLQDDPQVNYDVLLHDQLKEFYLLQPEQATLADNFYFIEKQ